MHSIVAQQRPETTTHGLEAHPGRPLSAEASSRLMLMVAGPTGSQLVELATHCKLIVGRSAPADLSWPDARLSRLHARFDRDGERVRVTDLDSRNGTWLRGERITQALLRPGDVLVLGATTVSLQSTPLTDAAMRGLLSVGQLSAQVADECLRARALRKQVSVLTLRPLQPHAALSTAVIEACLRTLRPIDRAALGERSLLILLPDASTDQAASAAEALLALGRSQLGCGAATYPWSAEGADELISAATEAAMLATASTPLVRAGSVDRAATQVTVRCSARTHELERLVQRIAVRPISALICGETGTGKELVANELHRRSPRHAGPFKAISCGALPEHLLESLLFGHMMGTFAGAHRDQAGMFEESHGGTLFLDEVGELSLAAQAALLRVLDTQLVCRVGGSEPIRVDVRVVSSTNRDLLAMTRQGGFRLDLYHRLSGVTLQVPPLRERLEEIPALVQHFLTSAAERWGGRALSISPAALARLASYGWPGNVRELRNAIEGAAALADGDQIGCSDLPESLRSGSPHGNTPAGGEPRQLLQAATDLRGSVIAHEELMIRAALEQSAGNRRKAAELLKLPLRTFERRLQSLGRAQHTRAD